MGQQKCVTITCHLICMFSFLSVHPPIARFAVFHCPPICFTDRLCSSVCFSACLPISLSSCLFPCLPVYITVHLSVSLSTCLSPLSASLVGGVGLLVEETRSKVCSLPLSHLVTVVYDAIKLVKNARQFQAEDIVSS